MPFLRNVTRGRGIPAERLTEVAQHYLLFGGKSPINDQCRSLLAALTNELRRRDIQQPLYWGNRNWEPLSRRRIACHRTRRSPPHTGRRDERVPVLFLMPPVPGKPV